MHARTMCPLRSATTIYIALRKGMCSWGVWIRCSVRLCVRHGRNVTLWILPGTSSMQIVGKSWIATAVASLQFRVIGHFIRLFMHATGVGARDAQDRANDIFPSKRRSETKNACNERNWSSGNHTTTPLIFASSLVGAWAVCCILFF